ncbi:MAG: hypothetical protein PHV33_07420 [Elusimicrobiales bacterium]|nr:hypothetical protein [Elusimicrobiales bacterium]
MKITLIPGANALKRFANSLPESPGITKSISTASGTGSPDDIRYTLGTANVCYVAFNGGGMSTVVKSISIYYIRCVCAGP